MSLRSAFAAILALGLLLSPAMLWAMHKGEGPESAATESLSPSAPQEPQSDAQAADEQGVEPEYKLATFEYELNPYYTSADVFLSLTNAPIPDVGEKPEYEIYRDLLLSSYVPRYMVLEASVNPMPLAGVAMKHQASSLYEEGRTGEDFNIWKAVTAGFEEPWAISLFMGNVVNFARPDKAPKKPKAGNGQNGKADKQQAQVSTGGNKGYMGYLLSAGNLHIKDNTLIEDNWVEAEWKIKGDRELPKLKMSWSFRVGGKFHGHPDITDVVYVSMRRSRLDFEAEATSIVKNSAFEYTFEMDKRTLAAVQHKFFVEKKYPNARLGGAFTIAFGFIVDTDRKYTGKLGDEKHDNVQVILRPNIEF